MISKFLYIMHINKSTDTTSSCVSNPKKIIKKDKQDNSICKAKMG